jgi:hypothetical protein
MDFGGKVLQTADNQLQFGVQSRFIDQLTPLVVQVADALSEAEEARRKFVLVQEALRVTVNKSCQSLSQLAQLLFDPHQGRSLGGGVGLKSASVFLGQPLRMCQ